VRKSIKTIIVASALTLTLSGVAAANLAHPLYAPHSHSGVWASYVAPATICPGSNSRAEPAAIQEHAMLCLINYARERRHLNSLTTSSSLMRSSYIKAKAILRCQQFSHTACGVPVRNQFFTTGYLTAQITTWSVGENIAWGTFYLGVPQNIMLAWLNSHCHRLNIFQSGWKEQGVALQVGELNGEANAAVWASDFGERGVALPKSPHSACE
jgi:uncharacterized protein YkwD